MIAFLYQRSLIMEFPGLLVMTGDPGQRAVRTGRRSNEKRPPRWAFFSRFVMPLMREGLRTRHLEAARLGHRLVDDVEHAGVLVGGDGGRLHRAVQVDEAQARARLPVTAA